MKEPERASTIQKQLDRAWDQAEMANGILDDVFSCVTGGNEDRPSPGGRLPNVGLLGGAESVADLVTALRCRIESLRGMLS
jgi:hypothetical protein